MSNSYDYGARFYDPAIGRFTTQDPLSTERYWVSPYNYVQNNPIMRIDPTGALDDWVERGGEKVWDENVTSADDEDLQDGDTYLGEAAVVFDGFWDESLGEGDNLYGEGAILANVTVYGPGGADDIDTYEGYTMTSNPNQFAVVAPTNGAGYKGNFYLGEDGNGGTTYNSNWLLNNGGEIPSVNWGNENNRGGPFQNPQYLDRGDPGYLNSVFIHRSNLNGWAGGSVSTGCLMVAPGRNSDGADWTRFNNQMNGVENFNVQVNRSFTRSFYDMME